jgi:segregation and condensation protein B
VSEETQDAVFQSDADDAADTESVAPEPDGDAQPSVVRAVEALLFLSTDPLSPAELADAAEVGEGAIQAALAVLAEHYAPGLRGIVLRELGGGWTLASDPSTEDAARRLFSRPRISTLSPAQAETLAIVAYLQPISRPEITRIRGVSADSASATLLDRGLIEEAGSSQFGATLYRTTTQFLKLRPALPGRAARRGSVGPHPRAAERATRAPAARG